LSQENSQGSITGLIESYRIISIFLTLSIYMINGVLQHYAVSAMLFLALCIVASAFLLTYLYRISFTIPGRLYVLLFLEIVGITALMIPTGGLSSPFIWYFLNPLLIISFYLQPKEKAIFLAANFILLSAAGYYQERTLGLKDYLLSHSNIILSYVLILILVNILFNYYTLIAKKREELRDANEKLEHSNAKIKGLIEDILFMYEAVQSISSQRDKREVLNILLDFAGRISPASQAFFLLPDCGKTDGIVSLSPIDEDLKEALLQTVRENYAAIAKDRVSLYTLAANNRVVLSKASNIRDYGIIGLIIAEAEPSWNQDEHALSLLFFARLGALLLEKIEVEAVNYELAIADEQNRIADDIHDSVIQRLFAMSCLTYDTLKKWNRMADNEKKEQTALVLETIQGSLKDLRSTIYNLSSKKQRIDFFKESLSLYLRDLERLSGVKMNIEIDGDDDHLSIGAKKALYRIVIETAGNAIRHGKSQNFWVKLRIGALKTSLTIRDDGTGFDLEKAEIERPGLGLYNIKSLIRIFNGSIDILTGNSGTTYEISFANADIKKKLEEN
jgi:NarL family two-component system sensor histidine kinase LiaS